MTKHIIAWWPLPKRTLPKRRLFASILYQIGDCLHCQKGDCLHDNILYLDSFLWILQRWDTRHSWLYRWFGWCIRTYRKCNVLPYSSLNSACYSFIFIRPFKWKVSYFTNINTFFILLLAVWHVCTIGISETQSQTPLKLQFILMTILSGVFYVSACPRSALDVLSAEVWVEELASLQEWIWPNTVAKGSNFKK